MNTDTAERLYDIDELEKEYPEFKGKLYEQEITSVKTRKSVIAIAIGSPDSLKFLDPKGNMIPREENESPIVLFQF